MNIAFSKVRLSIGSDTTELGQLILDTTDKLGRYYIQWFGFMAVIDLVSGELSKAPIGPITDKNRFYLNGNMLTAAPNWNYADEKPNDASQPVLGFSYVIGQTTA